MKNIALLLILAFSTTTSAFASPSKYWDLYKYGNFSGGTSKGVYLPSSGGLIPGLRSTEIKTKNQKLPGLFTSILSFKGKTYIASGDPAQLWKLTGKKLTKITTLKDEVMITKLIAGPKGDILAATLPNGKIYKIKPNGKASVLVKLPANHIWSLVLKGNNLYAGTGSKAEVFKINVSSGSFKKIWSCKEKHIMSLALYKKGILIGTSPEADFITFLSEVKKHV